MHILVMSQEQAIFPMLPQILTTAMAGHKLSDALN
jgi:hypothetical protein